MKLRKNILAAGAMAAVSAMALAGCSGGSDGGSGSGGDTVQILGAFTDAQAAAFQADLDAWSETSGIDVEYTGTGDFQTAVVTRVTAGDPPDIAIYPAPGILKQQIDSLLPARRPRRRRRDHSRRGRRTAGHRQGGRPDLRAALQRQRQVARLVQPGGVRGERLRRADQRRRTDGPARTRSSPTAPATPGASESSPAARPAGRPPTGSRSTCCATAGSTPTTTGSRTT